jgi:uncharacterized protein (TIGR03435 family)
LRRRVPVKIERNERQRCLIKNAGSWGLWSRAEPEKRRNHCGAARTLTRTVVDRTGLGGTFDFALDWSPDDAPAESNGSAATASMPPLLVAIQEQLGLKLEQQKGVEEYMVVERIEKPTEN